MYTLARTWSDLGRRNANNSLAAATLLYSAGERLTAANFNLLHTLVDEGVASLRTTIRQTAQGAGGGTPAKLAQPYVEAWVSHARGVYDICAEAQDEIGNLAATCAADTNNALDSALAEAAQSAPPAAALALGLARTAVNSANLALDSALAASRQFAAMTDAQVSATSALALRAGDVTGAGFPLAPFRAA